MDISIALVTKEYSISYKMSDQSLPEESFEDVYSKLTKEEIFLEYCNFLQSLPDLIDSESIKIIDLVKKELSIEKMLNELQHCDFRSLVNTQNIHLMKHLSAKLGFSLKFLCPPVKSCILCERKLTLNNKPTQVIVHNVTGPELYTKYIYRCRGCKLENNSKGNKSDKPNVQDIYYHSDRYGNLQTGWLFYKKKEPEYIKASNEVFFKKHLLVSYMNNLCHAWMSMEGQAESYNQTWLNSVEVKMVNLFLAKNPKLGKHFNQKIKIVNQEEDLDLPLNANSNEVDSVRAGQPIFSGMAEMHRKSLSQVILFVSNDHSNII